MSAARSDQPIYLRLPPWHGAAAMAEVWSADPVYLPPPARHGAAAMAVVRSADPVYLPPQARRSASAMAAAPSPYPIYLRPPAQRGASAMTTPPIESRSYLHSSTVATRRGASAMTAARRPAPIYVVNDNVYAGGEPGEGWTEIEIVCRKAYGCGDNIKEALDGLSLHVLHGDDPLVSSSLGIRINGEAHTRFNSELEGRACKNRELVYTNDRMIAVASIILVDEEQALMIMILTLTREDVPDLSYYLVYDHKDASLSIISWVPDSLVVMGMLKPVPKRTSNGAYELFLMVSESRDDVAMPKDDIPPFICVFSPLIGAAKANPTSTWEMKKTVRWNVPVRVYSRFMTDVTFSFQGKGIWSDLSQALIYCDLHTADSSVDFDCIKLPVECQLNLVDALDSDESIKMTRTMGCVRGSIWFVCIHRHEHIGDDLVTMWTLELPWGRWKKEAWFFVRELWMFDGFKESGLPNAEARYPVLMADGSLCFVLSGQFSGSLMDHICTFDIFNKRLLWHGSVYGHTSEKVAVPSDFVQRKHGSHKRKYDGVHPVAGPSFAARE